MASTNVWVWVGHMWSDRARLVLEHYGDRITDVSIFGWHVAVDGTLTQTFDPTQLDEYRARWPHLRFWLAFRNDGVASIFAGLRNSAAARAKLIQGLGAALDRYPWLDGIDIDLEKGGAASNAPAAEALFKQVADLAHGRSLLCSAALPPLTVTGSVGGEDWVRYKQLGLILDHVAIMSYDFAWGGSAPGPISPGFWVEQVYNWAATQITPFKISMGLPLYGRSWQIFAKPEDIGDVYRGQSGTYYAFWQLFTGLIAWNANTHDRIGWICYRDQDSQTLWGFLNVYDWKEPTQFAQQTGNYQAVYEGRNYLVRYGLPATTPIWGVTDNGPGSSYATYQVNAANVIDADGRSVSPRRGFTLTTEIIQREPVAATIIDDYATDQSQLTNTYTQPTGKWTFTQVTDSYKQYRGSGTLRYNHAFGTASLYAQARFQFPMAGTVGITVQGITADLSNTGVLRLLKGTTVLATKNVGAAPVGGAAGGSSRRVIGLRVRDKSARVYYGVAETSIPLALEATTTPTNTGVVEYTSTNTAWIDHTYLGDGWWYQPREAVEVTIAGQTKVLGRIPRTGVTWDEHNRFKPTTDVDEKDTRTEPISLDWVYQHFKDIPLNPDTDTTIRVRLLDHDLWLGRLTIGDRDGFSIVYFSDATTINHWRGRACNDFGLQGIALWSIGQEDIRLWDTLAGGELSAETKRLDQ